MSNNCWQLNPKAGLERNGCRILFGAERAALRALLSPDLGAPTSHRSDEDDYEAADGSWLRLRFDGSLLRDIEFLGGRLALAGIPLHEGARWESLCTALAAQGYQFRSSEWLGDGFDCLSLGINIATREQLGGDEGDDAIEWVIASSDWAAGDR